MQEVEEVLTGLVKLVVEEATVDIVDTIEAVVLLVVGESDGSQMLNTQNDGSVIGADSGPKIMNNIFIRAK